MDNLEFNKFLASILIGLLALQVFRLTGDGLLMPVKLENPILQIDTSAISSPTGAAEAKPLEPIVGLLATANIENGAKVAKKCAQCHTFDKGGMQKTGPNLWNVVMATVGHVSEFAYSSAMKEKGGKWDYEALNAFLHKPCDFIKGTKMSFVGLSTAQERADLIAYMRSLADTPAPLPT